MTLEFAIQPVLHGPGYEVVRTADKHVLTTVATAGEASQYIHNIELERRYDAERDGSAWLAVQAITDNPRDTGDDEITIAQWIDAARKLTDQPFGTLADGTVIYGTFDTTAAGQRSGCVMVRTPAINLTADSDGFVSGENNRDEWTINFDGASLAEISALRDFLNSGAVERMLAAAVAWERGDTRAPVA